MNRLRAVLVGALLAAPGFAAAAEQNGCEAFRWPIEHERAALVATRLPVSNGGAMQYDGAMALQLAPFAEAALPQPPERAPKLDASFAGHFTLPAPPKAGLYKVTLASDGWVDVIDNGVFLHPKGFSGARECDGARKSVKFELPARALNVQFSNVHDADIAVIVTPAE
jgi:hypothetical protein